MLPQVIVLLSAVHAVVVVGVDSLIILVLVLVSSYTLILDLRLLPAVVY